MNLPQRLAVEFALDAAPDLDTFIPLFHRWIQRQRLTNQLLVDVADYRHVPKEASVVLVGYQADVIVGGGGERAWFSYLRKRDWPAGDSFAESLYRRLGVTLSGALETAAFLEEEGIAVEQSLFTLRILDRLAASSDPESARAWQEPLRTALATFFKGDEVALTLLEQDARRAFAVRVRLRESLEGAKA